MALLSDRSEDSNAHKARFRALLMPAWARALVDAIECVYFFMDSHRRITDAGGSLGGTLGYEPDALLYKLFKTIVDPVDRNRVDGIIERADKEPVKEELNLIARTGETVRASMIFAGDGLCEGGIAAFILPAALKFLKNNGDWFRKLTVAVEQSPASVVITDLSGAIEYVNPKFTGLTGYSYDEVMGQNPRILKSGVQPDGFYREMWETLMDGREWRGEFHNVKKNGDSYWESSVISPIRDDTGTITHLLAIKEDITERKKAEEKLRISEGSLKARNLVMENDLAIAQMAVMKLLPEGPPDTGFLDIRYRYIPMDSIGGDFLSFNPFVEHGMGVFIGDLVGHGVSAALFLSMLKSVTDRFNRKFPSQPELYLQRLNREFASSSGNFLLTGIYGVFESTAEGASFIFARAGHPYPILQRKGAGAELVRTKGKPIGMPDWNEFEVCTLSLSRGDRLFLYTDGLPEMSVRGDVMLEIRGLTEIIDRIRMPDLGDTIDGIIHEADSLRGGYPAGDDIVLVGFEVL